MKVISILFLISLSFISCGKKPNLNGDETYYYIRAYTMSQVKGRDFLDSWGNASKPEKQEDGTIKFTNKNDNSIITLPADTFLLLEESKR